MTYLQILLYRCIPTESKLKIPSCMSQCIQLWHFKEINHKYIFEIIIWTVMAYELILIWVFKLTLQFHFKYDYSLILTLTLILIFNFIIYFHIFYILYLYLTKNKVWPLNVTEIIHWKFMLIDQCNLHLITWRFKV